MTSEELQTMACNYDDAAMSETASALRELATLRGRVLTEQQVRVEVLRVLGELMQAYHDTSVPFDAATVSARIADRVAKELAGSVVWPSEREIAGLKLENATLQAVADSAEAEVAKLTDVSSVTHLREDLGHLRGYLTETRQLLAEDHETLPEAARRVIAERDAARVEVVTLTERRDSLLQLVARLTRETPYPAELDECRSARSALIAEVGTLRAQIAERSTP